MNYKEVFTDKAVEQFRSEGATFILVSLFNEKDMIRDMEVRLDEGERMLSITGKSTAAQAALAKGFHGEPAADGRMWYKFSIAYVLCDRNPEGAVAAIAGVLKVKPEELEWTFKIEH